MIRTTGEVAYYALILCAHLTSQLTSAIPTDIRQNELYGLLDEIPNVLQRRDPVPSSGIFIYPGTCNGQDQTALENAVLDASYLAGAGLYAASKFSELPFRYFFKDDADTANTVAEVYGRVQTSQQGGGSLIIATCKDVYNACKTGATVTGAYAAQPKDKPPVIVFCPSALALPRNPTPCSQKPGVISLGSQMLHEMVHIRSISGHTDDEQGIMDTTGESARSVNDALDDGVDTTLDANSYAHLGSWSWDLGLGGPPWNQQAVCLDRFSTGQFDLQGLVTTDV